MAATDQNYRNQYTLDVVFAVSSVLLLVSTVAMFIQDYNREYKHEQRTFRDVESALAQRLALQQIPSLKEYDAAEKAVLDAREEREKNKAQIEETSREIAKLLPDKERSEMRFQTVKADLESITSFYHIEVEHHGTDSAKAKEHLAEINRLAQELSKVQATRDKYSAAVTELQQKLLQYEMPVVEAQGKLKKVTDRFDTQVKLANLKQWGLGDTIRNIPVLDGFAPPVKIHQFTINDIPIDFNFKYVTRFDRCMSCHQGIDRPAYSAANLEGLVDVTPEQEKKLGEAREILGRRRKALLGLPGADSLPDADDLRLTTISKSNLTPARLAEFRAHPRLDLFVGSESKHPAEKFGCTACHSGQGSATGFLLASHTPNDADTKQRWIKEYDWFYEAHKGNALWDYPMLPNRFMESSCLKCHHEVTDLVASNNRVEAPKVVKGYNLIKEFGCFGCHEISGRNKGRPVGPDLRLEPYPPLDDMTPAERLKAESDPDNPPGTLRKVGPSLFRLSEKTNREWTANWLQAPREFRPDTKMPHFYGLSNNDPSVLPEDQKKFPDAEMTAITHFLFSQSDAYLQALAETHKADAATRQKERERIAVLEKKANPSDDEKKELAALFARIRMQTSRPLTDLAPGYKGDAARGRILFSERGCLACHSHQALEKPQGSVGGKDFAPSLLTESQFGPDLSQVAEKLGKSPGDRESAQRWLTQWIVEPQVHSQRSRMPVTHLDGKEAADIAAWLLSQPVGDSVGAGWKNLKREADKALEQEGVYKKLARVYLVRILSEKDIEDLENGQFPASRTKELPDDERILSEKKYEINSLKHYLGKKAVGRLGCYACHDIPGFENAKPIGVGLNEWGKKDAERLAFDDIMDFVDKHYEVVDNLRDKDGKPVKASGNKMPYEKFYADLLGHHQREGFLNQKILDPRSYDHNRLRTWDDRSRMPQFRFARSRKRADDKDDDTYRARQIVEEAEAREAVATFVLGLVAEPVPLKMVNQPAGDRLAEVKGRQILDKFNCVGCHLVRPGYFELKNSPDTQARLDAAWNILKGPLAGDHFFANHGNWNGKPQPADVYQIHGVNPKFVEIEDAGNMVYLRLTEALRFRANGGEPQNLRASSEVFLPPKEFVYPPPSALTSEAALKAFLKERGTYGGYFADLLTQYLMDKLPKDYPRDPFTKDNGNARASVPPILLGQGERTQADWLYQFLLNPQPVRQMTLLRMPRFNMSKEEAKALVNYFAAVERINNPNIGLTHPYEAIAQQEDLDAPYWRSKTADYVSRLKITPFKDDAGKAKTFYEKRVQDLQPVWGATLREHQKELDVAKARHASAKSRLDEAAKVMEKEKDDAKKKALEDALKGPQQTEYSWKGEVDRLTKLVAESSLKEQQKKWEEREAYVVDGFKLLANTQLCLGCHQVGPLQPSKSLAEGRGPPLHLAAERIRPGWMERWVAHPQRYLTYQSVMPVNFPANKQDYQQWFVGSSADQVTAVRDVVMMFPRAINMPANRYWTLPIPAEAKKVAAGE